MYIWIIHGEFIQVEEAWKYDKKVVRISGWANYFLQASIGVIIHYCLTRLTFIHDHYLLKTTNIFIYYFFFFYEKDHI